MDENYRNILLAKYPDESEDVNALYRFFKDMQATRTCIEGIYSCNDEKELVSKVLVPLYVQGFPQESLNKSSFIALLSKFSENPFNVRSVQRYIREIFASKNVRKAREHAEERRYSGYTKNASSNGKPITLAFHFEKIEDYQLTALMQLLKSMNIDMVKVSDNVDGTDTSYGLTIGYMNMTMAEQILGASQVDVYRITSDAFTLALLIPILREMLSDEWLSVSYFSQRYYNENISLELAEFLAHNDAQGETV